MGSVDEMDAAHAGNKYLLLFIIGALKTRG